MDIKDVCTTNAPMRFFCPGPNTFFTASLLWGTVGPLKVFGANGQYKWLLMGFPLGIIAVLIFWGARQVWPHSRPLRQVHVIPMLYGGLIWAPLSMWLNNPRRIVLNFCTNPFLGFSYIWGAVPFAWLSWIYIRSRYLAFWSKVGPASSLSYTLLGIRCNADINFFAKSLRANNLIFSTTLSCRLPSPLVWPSPPSSCSSPCSGSRSRSIGGVTRRPLWVAKPNLAPSRRCSPASDFILGGIRPKCLLREWLRTIRVKVQ